MKRLTLLLTIIMMTTTLMMAERVTPETARKVASTFLNNNGAKSDQLTDLSKAAGFPNLYIFTTNEGFVVMAADDCVKPILGYSLKESFKTDDMPENLIWWLQGYNDQIQDAVESKATATTETAKQWDDLTSGKSNSTVADVVVAPLIQTHWDQGYPYNYYCPSGTVTGCVATAMAQVMKFWNYPQQGQGSHTNTNDTTLIVNFGETTYEWNNMPESLSGSPSQTEIDAVATLMLHCGVSVNMTYGSSSGAFSGNVPYALIDYFKYAPSATLVSRDGYDDEQWIAFLQSELNEGRPLFYSGSYTFISNGAQKYGGHAFVCDGYRSDNHFHFNWGWSGFQDDYWEIGSLNPGSGGAGSGSGTYNLNNSVAAWVEPISDLSAPTLSASNSETTVTLSWDEIEGATSYDVYRNNSKIASNVTSLNYTDSTVDFGHYYDYYIRAVSQSTISNPSNFVTISITYLDRIPQNPNATIAVSDNSVNITWNEPQSQSMDLHYGTGQMASYYGSGVEEGTYWGQCYPSESISVFDGMAIDRVSIYLCFTGNYSLFLYKDNVTSESNLLSTKDFSGAVGWNEIALDSIIPLDATKDLWIVFHTNDVSSPACYGEYYGSNNEHAHYLWYSFSENIVYRLHSDYISWPIKMHLFDGTFTYNVYRDNTLVAERHPDTVYLDVNLSDGAHKYYIKTYSNNWESNASDTISISYSTEHRISEAVTIHYDLVLSNYNRYTIEPTGILTVSGRLTNNNEENLILEDGAQLINDSEGVKATVKKTIQPYTEGLDNGWNLIASPVTGQLNAVDDVNGLIRGTYDLYVFDQTGSDGKEWRNYKAQTFTTIDNKVGYLYSNSNETTISFAGTLAGTVTPTTITRNDNVEFEGFNLIGNPYPCEVYTNQPFYTLQYNEEDDKTSFVLGQNPIPPCSAILVQAQTAEDSVTFSKSPLAKQASIAMQLSKSNTRSTHHIDLARISFDSGCQLSKYTWDDASSTIYIPQNGQNFAVAYANGQNEMPLNFKAAKNGTYTLAFEVENLDLDYLHLIDNMTGADVDLLATPSYSFEGKADDYESRFKLVFSNYEDANDDNVHFAYYADGEIRLVETCHGASLQVVDMMGRVVLAGDAMNRVSTNGMTAGVYVLRLINGNDVKTQKIVIE